MRERKNKSGTGFYIALCCCVALIGTIGYFTNREDKKTIDLTKGTSTTEAVKEALKPSEASNVNITAPTLSPTVAPKEEKQEVKQVSAYITEEAPVFEEKEADENFEVLEKGEPVEFYEGETAESVFLSSDPSFILPVNGEICEKFSGDTLIYNEAMGDWRAHNGIDIKTNECAEVIVSSDGIIEEIYSDYLGNTVVIDHKNGFKTRYSNLDTTEALTLGVKMKQGDFLAKVGSYNLGENTKEPHLHFEIIKNDKFVNPEEYIG